jgi:hypothetical protein
MKTPSEPGDELLKSLVEETNALPQAAAAHVRARQRVRMNTVRISAMLASSLLAAGIWLSQRPPRSEVTTEITRAAIPPEAATILTPPGYVKVHQPGEIADPDPIPPDASEREKKLLTDLPGVPLLIVKNGAGEVARVHIFER